MEVNVPEIRLKGFTGAWEQRKLGEIGTVQMCHRIFKEQTTSHGDVPFYKIGTLGKEPDAYITRELFEEYKVKYPYPEKGDLLISASGSIGKIVEYSGEDAYFQDSNIVWLQHADVLDNAFLKQFYEIVQWSGLEGTTIKRLYNKDILDTDIKYPTKAEQEKIGEFFRTFDENIILHKQKLDGLKKLKKGYLQQMFPQSGETVPRVRFDGFSEPWEQRKLGEHTAFITKGTTPIDKSGNGEINFVKVENIIDGKIKSTSKIFTEEHNGYLKRSRLEEDDILFSIAGTLGRTAVVDKLILPANTNQALAIIRDYDFDTNFLITSFSTQAVSEFIKKNPTIGAQPNLSLEQIRDLIIYTPSRKEQTVIGNFFYNLDNQITAQNQKVEQLKQLKAAYLQKMFV